MFGLGVAGLVLGQEWRQSERLVAAGLRSPRGAMLMPDGVVFVAEAGSPGVERSGRLTWVHPESGARGTLLEDLPSRHLPDLGLTAGPAAVAAWSSGWLILTGPCEQVLCGALLSLDRDGRTTMLADLAAAAGAAATASGAARAHPWGLAVASDGMIYTTDVAADLILRVDPTTTPATVTRHLDLPPGSAPTGVVVAPDGVLYVALLGGWPRADAPGAVARVTTEGTLIDVIDAFSMPIGVGVEPDGGLLVLELASSTESDGQIAPRSGRLLRIDAERADQRVVLASELDRPTSLLVAPDGRAFVSTRGAFVDHTAPAGDLLQIRRLGPQRPRRAV